MQLPNEAQGPRRTQSCSTLLHQEDKDSVWPSCRAFLLQVEMAVRPVEAQRSIKHTISHSLCSPRLQIYW
ncbi:hypothetical protein AOLI_G00156510 [Acnodon oligacanthus]